MSHKILKNTDLHKQQNLLIKKNIHAITSTQGVCKLN